MNILEDVTVIDSREVLIQISAYINNEDTETDMKPENWKY